MANYCDKRCHRCCKAGADSVGEGNLPGMVTFMNAE